MFLFCVNLSFLCFCITNFFKFHFCGYFLVSFLDNCFYLNNNTLILNLNAFKIIRSVETYNVYTVIRQAFLLIQYSFIYKQYFFCSDREYQYFFWQMVNNKTADCFNNIVLVVKISWKNGKQFNVGKDLMRSV